MSFEQILSSIAAYDPNADLDVVRRASAFAAKAHEGQTRRAGDPYVTHPLSVAGIIAELKLDVPSVCAGLLHDCVEDTSATVEQLEELFGKKIAFLVDGVTKLGKLPWSTKEEQQAEDGEQECPECDSGSKAVRNRFRHIEALVCRQGGSAYEVTAVGLDVCDDIGPCLLQPWGCLRAEYRPEGDQDKQGSDH